MKSISLTGDANSTRTSEEYSLHGDMYEDYSGYCASMRKRMDSVVRSLPITTVDVLTNLDLVTWRTIIIVREITVDSLPGYW